MANMMTNAYFNNPDDFVYPFVIEEKNGKTRTIITYKKKGSGKAFRGYHERVLEKINYCYKSNEHSFAYRKKVTCKNALSDHLYSNCFIKLDIHHFFESITFQKFMSEGYPFINKAIKMDEVHALFYKSNLSLGYVTSPIVSDIYLHTFDEAVVKYISNNPKLHYSRYCDDMLISTEEDDFANLEALQIFIEKELKRKGLSINKKKEFKAHLDAKSHNSLTFLGLNLSKNEDGSNRMTISKHFILKTIDLLSSYYDKYPDCNYLFKMIILSRIAYIKNSSTISYQRFLRKHQNRFNKAYKDI